MGHTGVAKIKDREFLANSQVFGTFPFRTAQISWKEICLFKVGNDGGRGEMVRCLILGKQKVCHRIVQADKMVDRLENLPIEPAQASAQQALLTEQTAPLSNLGITIH